MVAMKTPWVGLVDLLTPPTECGDTKCLTHVFVWAETAEDYETKISQILAKEGMSVLNIEFSLPISDFDGISDDLAKYVDWAKDHPDDWLTSDRHYYPSHPV